MTINTFGEWVEEIHNKQYTFQIPNYQRAYAWEESDAKILLKDLLNAQGQDYFLGLFLLEKNGKNYQIIDGQQRFTTLYILIWSILNSDTTYSDTTYSDNTISYLELCESFIYYNEKNPRLTLQHTQNEEYFKDIIYKGIDEEIKNPEYASQENIKNVISFFKKVIKEKNKIDNVPIDNETIKGIIETLFNSKILLHEVDNTGKAMQIFELLNDRGKSLTQLEAIKSFVMHRVYSLYNEDEYNLNSHLNTIKEYFSEIYKSVNDINKYVSLEEDDILRYSYIAFEEWNNQNQYRNVKDELKSTFLGINEFEGLKNKIEKIRDTFKIMHSLIEKAKGNKHLWLKNLFILNRMATFYPLLISLESEIKCDKLLEEVCNYLELFIFRAFVIMNKRTDAVLHSIYKLANEIGTKEIAKDEIIGQLKEILKTKAGDKNDDLFASNKHQKFYLEHKGIDGRYLFIKYENHLVSEEHKTNKQSESHFINNLDKIKTSKDSLSIDHIVAQNLVIKYPDYIKEITYGSDDDNKTEWFVEKSNKKEYKTEENDFKDNFLHSIGNLVISGKASNAAKGDKKPGEKELSVYKSQEEIVKEGFNVDKILERTEEILKFADDYWSSEFFNNKKISERNPLI